MKRRSQIKKRGEKPKKSQYERKELNRKKGMLSDNSPLPDGVHTEYKLVNGIQVSVKTVE